MPEDKNTVERIAELESRVAALSATIKSVLTTLMLRGLLNRAEIAPILAEADTMIAAAGALPAARDELAGIRKDLPAYMREAMGPPPDDDDHDH